MKSSWIITLWIRFGLGLGGVNTRAEPHKQFTVVNISKINIDFPDAGTYDENDPCFLKHLRWLHEELSVPNAIRDACIHEAGHWIYFSSLGAALNYSPDEFHFVRPFVSYRFNAKMLRYEFDHAVASTETPFNEDTIIYTDETLSGLAKACFAGGVFTDEFAKGSPRGDADDHSRFHSYYNSAIKQRGVMEIFETQFREQAITAITADLQNEKLRKLALLKADQFEVKCFS